MATKIGAYGFVEVSSLKQYNLNVLFDTALLAVIERSIHHLAYTASSFMAADASLVIIDERVEVARNRKWYHRFTRK